MDSNILYKILGHQSVCVDKTLTKYAIAEYMHFAKDVSRRIASLYVELLFHSYSVTSDEFCIYSVLSLSSYHKLAISIDNFGCQVGSIRWGVTYTERKLGSSHTTKKSGTSGHVTAKAREYLTDVVCDSLYEQMQHSRLDKGATASLQFSFKDTCMDATASQQLFHAYNFDMISTTIKETPSLSVYMYTFVDKI